MNNPVKPSLKRGTKIKALFFLSGKNLLKDCFQQVSLFILVMQYNNEEASVCASSCFQGGKKVDEPRYVRACQHTYSSPHLDCTQKVVLLLCCALCARGCMRASSEGVVVHKHSFTQSTRFKQFL